MKMKYVLDTHTHTVVSGHAYNTINEMMQAAADRGLELLGITEHAMAMPGACHEFYFQNGRRVPRERYGVKLLFGAEVNIMDFDGRVDMSDSLMQKMDIVIASMHVPCMKKGSRDQNTQAYIEVMKNPWVNIIGHPDDSRFPIDYEALVQAAREYGRLLEINNHSMEPGASRQGARENYLEMLSWCIRYEVPVVVGSDAHVDIEVGTHENAYKLLTETGFPEKLVANTGVDFLKKYVNCYK